MPQIRAIVAVDGDNIFYPLERRGIRLDQQRFTDFLCTFHGWPESQTRLHFFRTARHQYQARRWEQQWGKLGWSVHVGLLKVVMDPRTGHRVPQAMLDMDIRRMIERDLVSADCVDLNHLVLVTGDHGFRPLLQEVRARLVLTTLVSLRSRLSPQLKADNIQLLDPHLPHLVRPAPGR